MENRNVIWIWVLRCSNWKTIKESRDMALAPFLPQKHHLTFRSPSNHSPQTSSVTGRASLYFRGCLNSNILSFQRQVLRATAHLKTNAFCFLYLHLGIKYLSAKCHSCYTQPGNWDKTNKSKTETKILNHSWIF